MQLLKKLKAITDKNYEINYPDDVEAAAIDAMKGCLRRKPEDRLPIVGPGGLLNEHEFLHPHKKARIKHK